MKKDSLLAKDIDIKPSQLYVKDIQKVAKFYREVVKLESLLATNSHVILGQGKVPILELISKPEFNNAPIKSAGLFHNAILYSSRSVLAQTIANIFQHAPWSYEGTGDHLVSEAFYFHDPENNGLELYYDRPRDEWQWRNDRVVMDTLYIDPLDYIRKYASSDVVTNKSIGHVHLKVGDIPVARNFYVDKLGFDITADVGSALFVSVGGYHHHLGMNIWNSAGASKRDPSLGMGQVKIILPKVDDINHLANRLTADGYEFNDRSGRLVVKDPWNNELAFEVG